MTGTAIAGKSQERERRVQHGLNLSPPQPCLAETAMGQIQLAPLRTAGLRTALSGKGVFCCFVFVN